MEYLDEIQSKQNRMDKFLLWWKYRVGGKDLTFSEYRKVITRFGYGSNYRDIK